ncbi:MAG: hypothetical protein PHX04_00815 [Bacilli bacterium]|nr:hypothetical protein [Bacilli bacterium]
MRGKLIVIEGTDCSGKKTQSTKLVERLNKSGIKAEYLSFPMYDTPTGEIIARNILGKSDYGKCTFPEGTTHIPPKVAALYYAADRVYNISKITDKLSNGTTVILDRYVESNMGHQGAKFNSEKEKIAMLLWLEHLEFNLLELPKPDKVIFLYMPYEAGEVLRKRRSESKDGAERDKNHQINAEETYFLIKERYKFDMINCTKDNEVRTIEAISDDIYDLVKSYLSN